MGLDLAHAQLGIPRILSAEHLASEEMDELSGMTYLSYFMSGTQLSWAVFQINTHWFQRCTLEGFCKGLPYPRIFDTLFVRNM